MTCWMPPEIFLAAAHFLYVYKIVQFNFTMGAWFGLERWGLYQKWFSDQFVTDPAQPSPRSIQQSLQYSNIFQIISNIFKWVFAALHDINNSVYMIFKSLKLGLCFWFTCLYCIFGNSIFLVTLFFRIGKQIMFYFEKSNQEVCALEGSKYCNFPLVLTSLSGWLHNRMNIWTWQRMNILRELLLFKYFQLFSFVPKISQLCMNNLKQQRSLLLFNSCKNQKTKYLSSCTTIL